MLEIPFGDVTSVDLQYCLMGSFLRVNAAHQHWQVDFHSTWFPPLHSVYFAARQCMAQPLTKAARSSRLSTVS